MSGTKGKSGGARAGSGRPTRGSNRVSVEIQLSTDQATYLREMPKGMRSAYIGRLIAEDRLKEWERWI